jgi:hypothetical protein
MKRTDIINHIIKKNNYIKYLEIGVRNPHSNFNLIDVAHKDGVDPAGNCNYPMPSDDFFTQLDEDTTYDIIFIDGLHLDYQVENDIKNSLKHLKEGGTIVMHDCNPPTEKHQIEEYDGISPWNGTTWKAYAKFRMTDKNLSMFVVDTDWGVGVITKGSQVLFPKTKMLDYKLLDENRTELLNLISPEKFLTL